VSRERHLALPRRRADLGTSRVRASRTTCVGFGRSSRDPDVLLAGVWSDSNDGQGIYRSTDGGDSWQLTSGLDDREELKVPDIVYDPHNPLIVYAATHGGLRISFDGGLSWQVYPGVMGQLPITALAVAQDGEGTRLYVGTVGGTVVGQTSALRALQEELLMGAGVYVGHSRWCLLQCDPFARNRRS
jgi:hypothetical protein